MPDFDLDQFKASWQQQEQRYSQSQILQMLNKKSRNYVKYILWISILEFLVVIAFNSYYFSGDSQTKDLSKIIEKLGVKGSPDVVASLDHAYLLTKIFGILITLFFVVKFFLSYRQIHVESNLKKLIQQILTFKKTVQFFILTNIAFLVISTLGFIALILSFVKDQHVKVDSPTLIGFGVGAIIGISASVLLIWIYYRIIYGIIVKKLSKNLEQLKTIEQEQEQA